MLFLCNHKVIPEETDLMNIVLYEPEMPGNTGNIGRTCAATGTALHLIEPIGFHLNERAVKRSGMDYWEKVEVYRYADYADFLVRNPGARIWYLTTKAHQCYTDVSFAPDDFLMFGKESAGIPEKILVENEARCIRIPMNAEIRSLNLASSAAIVLYEALRQNGFSGMEKWGRLHELSWNS